MNQTKFLTIFLASMFTISACQAQEITQCQGPTITMTSTGVVESVPDIAEVMLNVKSEQNTEVEALAGLSDNLQKVVGVLEDLDIEDRDIRTEAININPIYDPRNRQEIIAYRATSRVYFKTFDLENITELMNGVMAGSENLFSSINYSSSKKAELEDQAREIAFKKAFHKATLYADLSQNSLGNVCTITEAQVINRIQPYSVNLRTEAAAAIDSSQAGNLNIPIKPGMITTTAQVTLVYSLED